MNLESMYQEIILDHYRRPTHAGLREPFEAQVHHINPTCGDEVTLRVHLEGADGGTADERTDAGSVVVADVSYEAQGCSISQASTSVMADLVVGERLDTALRLHGEFVELMQSRGKLERDHESMEESLGDAVAFTGVAQYPARVKCALLGWMALKDAAAAALEHHGTPARVGNEETV